jgi:hypothetical protein
LCFSRRFTIEDIVSCCLPYFFLTFFECVYSAGGLRFATQPHIACPSYVMLCSEHVSAKFLWLCATFRDMPLFYWPRNFSTLMRVLVGFKQLIEPQLYRIQFCCPLVMVILENWRTQADKILMGNSCSCGIAVVSDATSTKQGSRGAGVDYEDDCLPTVPRSRVNLRDGPTPSSFGIEEHALPHQPERLEESMIFPRALCEEPTIAGDKGEESVETASEPDDSCIGNPLSHQTDSNNASDPLMHRFVPRGNEGTSVGSRSAEIRAFASGASLFGTSCASRVSVMSRPVSPHSGVSSPCDARQTQVSFRSYAFVLGVEPSLGDEDKPQKCCALPVDLSRSACVGRSLSHDPPSTPLSPCVLQPACSPAVFSSFDTLRSASCHSDLESLCEEVRIPASPGATTLVPLLPPTSPQRCQIARRKRSSAAMTLSGTSTRRRQRNQSTAEHQDVQEEIGFNIALPTLGLS